MAFYLTGHVSPHKYNEREQQFQAEMSFQRPFLIKFIPRSYTLCRFYFFGERRTCLFIVCYIDSGVPAYFIRLLRALTAFY